MHRTHYGVLTAPRKDRSEHQKGMGKDSGYVHHKRTHVHTSFIEMFTQTSCSTFEPNRGLALVRKVLSVPYPPNIRLCAGVVRLFRRELEMHDIKACATMFRACDDTKTSAGLHPDTNELASALPAAKSAALAFWGMHVHLSL